MTKKDFEIYVSEQLLKANSMDNKLKRTNIQIIATDIYIERYLPVKVLNMVHDLLSPQSFGRSTEKKRLMENFEAMFSILGDKIKKEEQFDAK